MSISVIVRVRDEADALNRCLTLIREQTGVGADAELIVVDNDSHDSSAAVARRHGAAVTRISRDRFSFGRALNLGASLAHCEILVALSAHAFPTNPDWLDRVSHRFEDPTVVAACGERFWPDGSLLRRPVRYGERLARGYPRWGYSNAAGAFRARCWGERRFREDLPGAEDREWARYWALERDRVTLLDPGLLVEHDHTHDPVLEIFKRARRESQAFSMFLDPSADPVTRSFASEWFWDTRFYENPWRARLSHRRLARVLGERIGRTEGRIGRARIARIGP